MNLRMTGLDFNTADVRAREGFAFPQGAAKAAVQSVKQRWPHLGCVLLSTCNRTELWISGANADDPSALEILCWLKGIDYQDQGFVPFSRLFTNHEGSDAAEHLFYLACGLKSRIMGEDQILAQVRDALMIAREAGTADGLLERSFQTAIAYAKRAKTETALGRANLSTATGVLSVINAELEGRSKLKCLIIGNGVIGRKTADCLIEAGHQVAITLRKYTHGETIVPAGCATIPYDDRYQHLPDYDVVVSATVSPHYTLSYNKVVAQLDAADNSIDQRLFFDLSMPSDIQEEVGTIAGVTLINIDGLNDDRITSDADELEKVEAIIDEGLVELTNWHAFRDYVSEIDEIKTAASADIITRVELLVGKNSTSQAEADELREAIGNASRMVIGKMMFGLRESLDSEVWEPCFAALSEAAAKPAVFERNGGTRTGKKGKRIRRRNSSDKCLTRQIQEEE